MWRRILRAAWYGRGGGLPDTLDEQGRPPGIPDEAWRRWTQRTAPAAPGAHPPGGAARRIVLGDGDARNGPCDLCGGEAAPFSSLALTGSPPYVVCAACRATLARLARLAGGDPIQLL